MEQKTYAVLVTVDRAYIPPLQVMLRSLLRVHPENAFDLYLLHSSLEKADLDAIAAGLPDGRCRLLPIQVGGELLADAPVTDRYPKEMYYRIFAARYLPGELDRVLYLDPDLVVINPLHALFQMDLEDYFFAAASHVHGPMQKLNELRLDMEEPAPYINTGVMLLHLAGAAAGAGSGRGFRLHPPITKTAAAARSGCDQRAVRAADPASRSLPLQYDGAVVPSAPGCARVDGSGLGAPPFRHHSLLRPEQAVEKELSGKAGRFLA